MEPRFRRGSSVLVLKTKNVKVGDVIAFKYSGRVLIKRVQEVWPEGMYKVTGDNANDSHPVPPISAREIIGKVIYSY